MKKSASIINLLLILLIAAILFFVPKATVSATSTKSISAQSGIQQEPPTINPTSTENTPYPSPATQAPTAVQVTPTLTTPPPAGYERPVIVVKAYSISQDTISPGDSFTLFVTLYNAGQHYATNIVSTFIPGDLIPRDTGGVIAVGEIAPGNRSEFGQPLILDASFWGTTVSINMAVSYTDEAGVSYNEAFAISLPVVIKYYAGATSTPTPTATSPTPAVRPQLVITSYETDMVPLQPGVQFNLSITVQNMGSAAAKHVTMVVGGASASSGESSTPQPGGVSGASGEFTNFAPINASNVQSFGELVPGQTLSANQPLIVNVNTAPGAYPLKISFISQDAQNHSFTDDQVITLLVYRLPMLQISFYQEVGQAFVGQPTLLPIQVVNLARNSVVLGTMRVTGEGGQFTNNSIFIGTLDTGGYFTLDATYTPNLPGSNDLLVTIDYTDDFNQSQVITQSLTIEVVEQPAIEPSINGGQIDGSVDIPSQPETFLHKIWRFFLGLIGLDSGLPNSQSGTTNQPIETASPEQPIIVPAKPPMKGP